MTYTSAKEEIKRGAKVRRPSWARGRHLRMGNEGDRDFIDQDNIEGMIVDDCPQRHCDCEICIYNPTPEDLVAEDFEVVQ